MNDAQDTEAPRPAGDNEPTRQEIVSHLSMTVTHLTGFAGGARGDSTWVRLHLVDVASINVLGGPDGSEIFTRADLESAVFSGRAGYGRLVPTPGWSTDSAELQSAVSHLVDALLDHALILPVVSFRAQTWCRIADRLWNLDLAG